MAIPEENHNFFKCIDCSRQLADVVVTRECEDISHNYVALCPYCDSQSETKTIKGIVAIGSVPGTKIKGFPSRNGKTVIELAKEVQ